MKYNIVKIDDSACYVQYKSKTKWKFYIGSDHIRFDNERNAYAWIVKKKFGGNEDNAKQATSYSDYVPVNDATVVKREG